MQQCVAFKLKFKFFKKDLPIYHIESVILEMDKDNRFNDGRHIIYVNCEYLKKHPEPVNELDKLIHDMQCEDVNKIYSKEIKERMSYLKNPESEGFSKMSEWSESYYKKGIQTEKEATILSMYKKNLSIELIAECTRTTVEEVKKIIANNTDSII